MDFFGLFGDDDSGGHHQAAQSAWASLESKIDRLMVELNVPQPDVEDALPRQVSDLIARGNKIEAIKVYREMTGVGLKEAKDAVDGTAVLSPILRLERKVDALLNSRGIAPARTERAVIPANDDITQLLRSGKKIEAIALYLKRHNCGLKVAKDAVDALEREIMNR